MLDKRTKEMFDEQTIAQIENVKADYLQHVSVYVDPSKISNLTVVHKGDKVTIN